MIFGGSDFLVANPILICEVESKERGGGEKPSHRSSESTNLRWRISSIPEN